MSMIGCLAACQPLAPVQQGQAGGPTQATQTLPTKAPEVQAIESRPDAAPVRVFLADTAVHTGWVPVSLKPDGVLYVRTDPVLTRDDLMGVQAATAHDGSGILILILNDEGLQKIHRATAAHPGLKLALVVGHTMLAAPGYAVPISEQQLAFGVGTRANADLAARAVAGRDREAGKNF
ncbi:MAG: hypothetical protein L0H54_06230 [Alcaligenaceae bacterium]|nr:hypothetical protein [Alcaligenaceae bacterium]